MCNFFSLLTIGGRDVKKEENFLKEKELLFCRYYYILQNAKEAAIKAGYSRFIAEKTAQKLLVREDIKECLDKMKSGFKKDQIFNLTITALKRIIFYRPNDVLVLALKSQELSEKQIENLDLFQISEIKKLKDGGFEFKFADRVKAIDSLISLIDKIGDDSDVNDFLKALSSTSEDGEDFGDQI